jgi:acetoin utilization protein AcuC
MVAVYHGEELARYGFGHGHPFGTDRLGAFWSFLESAGLSSRVKVLEPGHAGREELELFHTAEYVDRVERQSETGVGFLDYGDTPAYEGVYEAAACVVGTTLDATERLVSGEIRRAMVPIAGLHHARRGAAGGFCVFNDCGIVIEALRQRHGLSRVVYVDIDAHHGDGVLYGFEEDPELFIVDIHESGKYLYPGTGWPHESGKGPAEGTKLNVPLPPGAGDAEFLEVWQAAEELVEQAQPEMILLQCGSDGLAGDPITHLEYSSAVHHHAAGRLCELADRHCGGRVLAMGGGGYNRRNMAEAWAAVVDAFLAAG